MLNLCNLSKKILMYEMSLDGCMNCVCNKSSKKGYFKRIIEIRLIRYSESSLSLLPSLLEEVDDELLLLLQICVVIITNFCKSSKLKFDKLYSNSQGTLFRVNFALNLENSAVLWFEKFLPKLLTISSILFTLSENRLIQSFV